MTGSQAFSSAIFMPGTAIVQPAAYIRGLADALAGKVTLYEQSPAMSFEPKGNGWRVETPGGSVAAGRIVLANNGYAERFGFFRGRLMHVYTYASMTESFSPNRLGGLRDWAATPSSPMAGSCHLRLTPLKSEISVFPGGYPHSCDPRTVFPA